MVHLNRMNNVNRHRKVSKHTPTTSLVLASPIKGKPWCYIHHHGSLYWCIIISPKKCRGKEKCLAPLPPNSRRPGRKMFIYRESVLGTHICHPKAASLSQYYHMRLISKEGPLKYILKRPTLNGRLAKRIVLFQQYNIESCPKRK